MKKKTLALPQTITDFWHCWNVYFTSGKNCTVAMDACFDNSCSENGTLQCRAAGSNYTCDCKPGYTGQLCSEDVNECEGKPCQNEGNCTNLSPGYK